MCGIAGIITKDRIDHELLEEMVSVIRYRGPDDTGFYIDGNVGLGHVRLSIMDPRNGKQPITNESGSIAIIFNGEIYNHRELRRDLAEKGHILVNNSDTAILPHMYEEYGLDMFEKLNGQFAIALWDRWEERLVLGRDRLGEKPLYYYHKGDSFCFASEAKAIFKSGLLSPEISPVALKQVFTFWTPLSDKSIFKDVYQVPPGCFLEYKASHVQVKAYWRLTYSNREECAHRDADSYLNELDDKLRTSVKGRMMSDVPISFYLSGGLDSSLIAGIAARLADQRLNTFSITFDDNNFDESEYQDYMVRYLDTNHQKILFPSDEIPSIIRDVIYHTEVPLLRSGAFPMYVLARLVRSNDTKVVLSGEGSDELFGGYDIFREVKIREFCSRIPDSKYRAALYKRVNNFVKGLEMQSANSLSMFYNNSDAQAFFSSHMSRWRLGAFSQQFFSSEYRENMRDFNEFGHLQELLPGDFMNWTPVQRAQYLEVMIFFSNYLLSSQGDRVSMAASVECRYPFLDYDVVGFANSLPDTLKIKALKEKYIVKKLAERYVPEKIINRKKFPYRAPINIAVLMKDQYVKYVTSIEELKRKGIFDLHSAGRFLSALEHKPNPSERDCMLFMGILTTQILYDQFIG